MTYSTSRGSLSSANEPSSGTQRKKVNVLNIRNRSYRRSPSLTRNSWIEEDSGHVASRVGDSCRVDVIVCSTIRARRAPDRCRVQESHAVPSRATHRAGRPRFCPAQALQQERLPLPSASAAVKATLSYTLVFRLVRHPADHLAADEVLIVI